jgi:DNA replication protein DnaD
MPKVGKEKEKEYMAIIRSLLARNPKLTILQIKDLLEKSPTRPLSLDKDYINKLINKIRKERIKRLEYYTLGEVLAQFQDEAEELKQRLWAIILNKSSDDKNVVAAIKEIRGTNKDLFDKMFESGYFERALGKLKLEHGASDEDKEIVKRALENAYGNRDARKDN